MCPAATPEWLVGKHGINRNRPARSEKMIEKVSAAKSRAPEMLGSLPARKHSRTTLLTKCVWHCNVSDEPQGSACSSHASMVNDSLASFKLQYCR